MVWRSVEASSNMMAHAQKPDFVFKQNGRVHLNRPGASVQSTTDSRGVRISGSNAGYTMFRGSVKGTGYPLHSPVSPSLPLPCVTVCHHISTGVYQVWYFKVPSTLWIFLHVTEQIKRSGHTGRAYRRRKDAGWRNLRDDIHTLYLTPKLYIVIKSMMRTSPTAKGHKCILRSDGRVWTRFTWLRSMAMYVYLL